MALTFEYKTSLPASASEVWRRATTAEGINDELFPLLRMTVPPAMQGRSIDELPLGQPLGRSWLLALCVLPVDYDDMTLAEAGPGYRFKETSQMFSLRNWVHERTILATTQGCEVHDRLTYELKRPGVWVPGYSRVITGLLKCVFRHRHARLTRWASGRLLKGDGL